MTAAKPQNDNNKNIVPFLDDKGCYTDFRVLVRDALNSDVVKNKGILVLFNDNGGFVNSFPVNLSNADVAWVSAKLLRDCT